MNLFLCSLPFHLFTYNRRIKVLNIMICSNAICMKCDVFVISPMVNGVRDLQYSIQCLLIETIFAIYQRSYVLVLTPVANGVGILRF